MNKEWRGVATARHGRPDLVPDRANVIESAERIPWIRPILDPDESLLADIHTALSSGRVTNDGPNLREFERRLASYLGAEDCVAVSSGSAALLLAIWALDLRGGMAVLPSFTFFATVNAIVLAGMTPVFCDVEPDTWTMSPAHLGRLLDADPSIRLVVPVNVFGVQPDLAAIRRTIDSRSAALLLDNAHGFGTEQGGVRCPPEVPVQAYSFHATKVLPAVEGGAVVASDPRLLAEVRQLRNHGVASDPLASGAGFNAKMSELHAAVGLRSLQGLEDALARRREYGERLRRTMATDCANAFTAQVIPRGMRSNFQNLGMLCRRGGRPNAPSVQAALDRLGIETRRYFWPPLHQLPAYRGRWSLPFTEAVGEAILCLPLHSRMDPPILDRIEDGLRRTAGTG
jgi:dTDP-4-amino-4,6-dideoxygalactose transaminase